MIGFFWNVMLALLWMVLNGTFSITSLLVGFFFGYLALLVMRVKIPLLRDYTRRLPLAIGFALFFFKEMMKANFRVAHDVVTPKWHMRPGVIGVPLNAHTDMEILFLTSVISLTPGTLSLDVSDDRRMLFIHAMFLQDEETLRRDIKDLERRMLAIMR